MKILIVEDDDSIREMLSDLLSLSGYISLEACNGAAAIKLAAQEKPDLIFMDLNMPILNGWDATFEIKRKPDLRHIPIIALSALCYDEIKENALKAGFDDCIMKPFDVGKLMEKVNKFKS